MQDLGSLPYMWEMFTHGVQSAVQIVYWIGKECVSNLTGISVRFSLYIFEVGIDLSNLI